MTARVEITNPHINATNVRVRQVVIEKTADGQLVVRPEEHDQHLIPGQRFASHVGETVGRALLIEELP